ncbi:MAG: acyl--CoA ligase [Magnetococcales bacterium]|nr:acyl--CoA ligase [Magnetococcales bacterium]
MPLPRQNIALMIAQAWQPILDRPIYALDAKLLDRRAFLNLALLRAIALGKQAARGDRILVLAGRGVESFIDIVAVWGMGGVIVPVAGEAPDEQIRILSTISGAVALCGNRDIPGLTTIDTSQMSQGDTASSPVFENARGFPIQDDPDRPEDLCAILFTSGSTGTPKGVRISHRSLAGNAQGTLAQLPMDGDDRLFINIGFHFTSAICHFLACAFSEACLIGVEKKQMPRDMLEAIIRNRATLFGGAPVQIRWIGQHLKSVASSKNLEKLPLTGVISSGDHLPVEVIETFRLHAYGIKIYTLYGLTETGGRFCFLPPEELEERAGSVGKPIKGLTLKVVHPENGSSMEPGEVGEIIAGGELLFDGYFNNPEATRKGLTKAGFRTGDLGYCDEEGFLFVQGRLDDVFKVNGQKVSAVVIMERMMALGWFQDVGVIARETEPFGTVPVAFCVMKPGVDFHKGRTLRALRKQLSGNHLPHRFVQVEAIPRTGSGKIQRGKLRQWLVEGLVSSLG